MASRGADRIYPALIIYRGSASIGRIVKRQGGGFVGGLFAAYGHYYWRVTSGIRRRQEVAADLAAARVAGPGATADALRMAHAAGDAHQDYVASFVAPALRAGRAPSSVIAGFRRFLAEPVHAAAASAHATDLSALPPDPFDSHPALGERLARLAAVPAGPAAPDGRASRSLLVDPDGVEAAVGATWLGAVGGADLASVTWADFGPVVIGPIQEREAALVLEAAHRVAPEVPPAQLGPHEIVDLVVGRPRELVGSLVAVGAGRPVDDGAERRMLRAATRATLGRRRGGALRLGEADVVGRRGRRGRRRRQRRAPRAVGRPGRRAPRRRRRPALLARGMGAGAGRASSSRHRRRPRAGAPTASPPRHRLPWRRARPRSPAPLPPAVRPRC
jgi:hypothetical protein